MLRQSLALLLAGLLALSAAPVMAQHIDTAMAFPACNNVTYNVSASALVSGKSYVIYCTISGYAAPISAWIPFTAPSSGTFNGVPITQAIGPFTGNFTLSGLCQLLGFNTLPITIAPSNLSCLA
jgi:hypothetical protein